MLRILYKFSLVLNVVLMVGVPTLIYLLLGVPKQLIQEYLELYYERRVTFFESMPRSNDEIIFIGASHVEGANWSELFQNPKIINRGISGDRTSGILKRLDEIIEGKPAKIFIQVGYNDLNAGVSKDEILKNYEEILKKIKDQRPQTQIYVQSVLPVLYKLNGSKVKNEVIIELNSHLEKLTKQYQVTFIDLFEPLKSSQKSQELDEKYTNDGLHLKANGYLQWKVSIEKFVNS